MSAFKEQERAAEMARIHEIHGLDNMSKKKFIKSMSCIGGRRDGIQEYYNQEEQDDDDIFEDEEQLKLFVSAKDIDLNISEKCYEMQDKVSPRSSSASFDINTPVPPLDLSMSDASSYTPSPRKKGFNLVFSPEAKRKNSAHSSLKISIPSKKPKQRPSMQFRRLFEDKYTCLEKLGQGALGEVRHCRVKGSKQEFAVKIIPFKDGEQLLDISKEFFLLESLRHPNLIRAYDFFIENKKCLIIIDYIQGFSLTQFLKNHSKMNEDQAKFVMSEAIKAVQYLHYKGVCHRDITANNILIDDTKHSIKLIDLSNSKSFDFAIRMMTKTGTLAYMAPEIFSEQEYDKSIDLWSLGVVLFQLLSGMLPFFNECETALIADIQNKEIDFSVQNPLLAHCSLQSLDFLSRLLTKNPANRLTVAEAICHPWLQSINLMCSFKKKIKNMKNSLDLTLDKSNNDKPSGDSLTMIQLQDEEGPRERADTAQEPVNVTRYAQRCMSTAGWSKKTGLNLDHSNNIYHGIENYSLSPEKISPSTGCNTALISMEKDDCEMNQSQDSLECVGIFRNISPCKNNNINLQDQLSLEDSTKKRQQLKYPVEQEEIFEEEREDDEQNFQKQSLKDTCCFNKAWMYANNDTNFNNKGQQIPPETLELELEVRKRSRSSIFYSPLI